jgi:periplasmic protein TonB
MNPITHLLNICTLALWLSVAGFGTVGMLVSQSPLGKGPTKPKEPPLIKQDFTFSVLPAFEEVAPESPAEPELTEPSPEPPPMPEIAMPEVLPEIPNIPQPSVARAKPPLPDKPAVERKEALKPVARAKPTTAARPAAQPVPASGKPSSTNTNNLTGPAKASATPAKKPPGLSKAARLAAGRMPSPSYPASCRRNRQEGTVVVEFTVNPEGRVTAAFAKKNSPWPELDQAAVRAVFGWKFPPGEAMTLSRPITFKLK